MSLDLSQPRVIFNKNPLKVVVIQVRFSPILALAQPAGVAAFQEAIRETYTRAEAPGQQVTLAVGPSGLMPPMSQPGPWRFLDDQGWIVGLATDYISLESTNYERYEEFEARAKRVLEVAGEVLGLRERGRLGLRYVNEIHHPDAVTLADWRNLLNPDLLGVAGGDPIGSRVQQTGQQIDVRLDDGGTLTVRHGWSTSQAGPSPYAIDLDAHDDEMRPYSVDEILARSESFRAWIGGFFRLSLGKELYEYLDPRVPGAEG